MTVVDDGRTTRRRVRSIITAAFAVTVLPLAGSACDSGAAGRSDGPAASAMADPPLPAQVDGVPAADLDAIRTTVDAVNAAAGGPPADQQRLWARLVEPARRDALERCPASTTTVRFEPVYAGLRLATTAESGDAATPTYALPTLIRVYTGDRVTGTDLTTLLLTLPTPADGVTEAYLTPFCVN